MNLLFTVIGGKFKFQVKNSDLEYIFLEIWRFEKHIATSEKKTRLVWGRLVRAKCTVLLISAPDQPVGNLMYHYIKEAMTLLS